MVLLMGFITLTFLVLALPVATLCSTDDRWLHHIYVDNQTGCSDPSCWEGGYFTPCLSLNLALTGAQHYNHSITILLQPGKHQLYNGSETQLRNISQLAIVGNGSEGEVVINCESLAGLAFFWSEGIEINNVYLFGCGTLQNSTSTNIGAHSTSFLQIRAALFFSDCSNVTLNKVHVVESPGTGVVMYNTLGVVNIDKCLFLHNGFSSTKYGGGGLVMDANEATSELSCTITSSNFTHNTASSEQFVFLSLTTSHDHGYFGLGRGGGISVVFRGTAVNNIVHLENVSLDGNTAQFGGGLFLGFLDNTSYNKVHMDNSWLRENVALVNNGYDTPQFDLTEGGGVSILMSGASDNAVVISNTNFVSNEAHTGGGIAVNVLHNSYKYIGTGNRLLIDNCKFTNNTGFQGASAYFSQNSNHGQSVLSTTVSCSSFNGGYCGGLSLMNGYRSRAYGLSCYGNVLLQSFQMILEGTVMFNNNQLSALSLLSSSIKLLPLTQLEFKQNIAINGAAIYVMECSSIIVNHNATLIFQRNTASNLGGAIYAENCCNSGLTGVESCFIRHANSTLHPNYWGITVNFTDNNHWCSHKEFCSILNSIYVDTINLSPWPESSLGNSTHKTFCWIGWTFKVDAYTSVDCHKELTSGPAYVSNTGPSNYTVSPGEWLSLEKYFVYDNWNNNITDQVSFVVDVVSGTGRVYMYMDNYHCDPHCNRFQVWYPYDQDYVNKSVLLLVHPLQFLAGVLVNVSFKLCENGSIYEEGVCQCSDIISSHLVCTRYSSLCSTCYDDISTCDIYTNKRIVMCNSCADSGSGVAVNFPYFVCTKSQWYGIILVLLELVLVLLMMIILSVFHINITSGSMNGFILYSQLVSLDLPGLGSTAWVPSTINTTYYMNTKQFASVPLTVYSIWNLNFLTLVPTPFSIPNTSAAGVILLQYIKATCPLLFILVTYVWIRWYNNGYRFVVYTTRPVHQLLARFWQKFKIQPSLIDTYAGLMLLSYMQFLAISIKISYTAFYGYVHPFSKILTPDSLLIIIVSSMSLLFFALPLLTVLLLYHFKIFQRCLTRCKLNRPGLHALVDAYQGCFKNSATDGSERRYFAGIYLFFRFFYFSLLLLLIGCTGRIAWWALTSQILPFVLLVEVLMSLLMIGIVVILRPYKKTAHNVIDFLIFFFMTLIPLFALLDLDLKIPFTVTRIQVDSQYLPFRNIIYLPFLVVTFYALHKFLKYCCLLCCKRCLHQPTMRDDSLPPPTECTPLVTHPTTSEVALNDGYVQDDLYTDHILHPGGYNEQHVSRYQSIQDSTENRPLTPVVAYGNKSPPPLHTT